MKHLYTVARHFVLLKVISFSIEQTKLVFEIGLRIKSQFSNLVIQLSP